MIMTKMTAMSRATVTVPVMVLVLSVVTVRVILIGITIVKVIRLMDKILHDPKDPKLWELWYIPGSCRTLSINRSVSNSNSSSGTLIKRTKSRTYGSGFRGSAFGLALVKSLDVLFGFRGLGFRGLGFRV